MFAPPMRVGDDDPSAVAAVADVTLASRVATALEVLVAAVAVLVAT
jgi:2-oxoglutarate dehydrogenase complex dehydrogenase (E1) component-like enzyme